MTNIPPNDLETEIVQLKDALATALTSRESDTTAAIAATHKLTLLESMMETVPVGVVLADVSGQIIHGNRHVETMLRHPVLHSSDVDSYGEWISFHEDGRKVESHEYPLSQVLREGKTRSEIAVHYQRGDGSRFWMRIIGEPVLDGDNQLIGATVALIDIDEERRLRASQEVLIAELNHRVKNAFAVVKSIVSQSLRKVHVSDEFRHTIDKRLDAYASSHAKLIGTNWDFAPISAIAEEILTPIGGDRIHIVGPKVNLPSRQALAFSMAFYELATNAVKYGALSASSGTIDVTWKLREEDRSKFLDLGWVERGGPIPEQPSQTGFGSFITQRALQAETGGTVCSLYPAEGFEWSIRMPLDGNEG